MRSQKIVSLVFPVVAAGLVTPPAPSGDLSVLVARQQTGDKYCREHKLDDSDPSVAKDIWDNTGTGAWFDEWLSDHKSHRLWTRTMDNEVNRYAWCFFYGR